LFNAPIALAVAYVLTPWSAAFAAPGDEPVDEPRREAGGDEATPGGTDRGRSPRRAGSLPERPFDDDSAGKNGTEEYSEGPESEADRGGETDEEPAESSLRALACLEGEGGEESDGSRRGVQKKDFLKKRRAELSALAGFWASDTLSSSHGFGGAAAFFLSEDFGVELLVARRRIAFRLEDSFNAFDGERHFLPGTAWDVLGAMLWSPVHAKLRWSEKRITHADLLVVAGAGQTVHDSVQGLTFQAGLGLKLYLARFFSIRFDVRDLIVPQDVLGRPRVTHNIAVLFGLAGWVPG
jgi:outer membrane beta-barrel protein